MDRFTRILQLHRILAAARFPVSRVELQRRLECSRATFCRALDHLRDDLGAPVEYDAKRNGYYYRRSGESVFELPGLWLSADEIQALLAIQKLVGEIDNGFLENIIAPFRERIEHILQHERMGAGELANRVRILGVGMRRAPADVFRLVAEALVRRHRLGFTYHARGTAQSASRVVSPQRLINYRHNWYLDAWCHTRSGLRTFALERISGIELLEASAVDISEGDLDRHFTGGYGIFAGEVNEVALLRFSSDAARWVADETWHPKQQGRRLSDGGYELCIPISRGEELTMDIMRFGEHVEVVAPEFLRREVADRLRRAAAVYERAASRIETPPGVGCAHEPDRH